MTEDEAKKKQCPYGLTAGMMLAIELGKKGNDSDEIAKTLNDAILCAGAECMMWVPSKGRHDKIGGHCGLVK